VVGGTGLTSGLLLAMKVGSGKGCCGFTVLVCDDCKQHTLS
jgi:hypothetical protein